MRRPQPFRRISSPGEREAKRAELREQEIQLRSPDMVGLQGGKSVWAANPTMSANHSTVATQKSARLKRELEQEMELIERHKKNLEQNIKTREEWIASQRCPRDWEWAKEGTVERRKATENIVKVEQSPAYQKVALELQNLYRTRSAIGAKLNGSREDPNCADLGHLRK